MVTCTPLVDMNSLLQPLMLRSVFQEGGGEFPLDALVNIQINEQITNNLLSSITLPQDFASFGDLICLQLELGKVRTIQALLRGETIPPEAGLDKILELVVNLQMLSAISSAFTSS